MDVIRKRKITSTATAAMLDATGVSDADDTSVKAILVMCWDMVPLLWCQRMNVKTFTMSMISSTELSLLFSPGQGFRLCKGPEQKHGRC